LIGVHLRPIPTAPSQGSDVRVLEAQDASEWGWITSAAMN
jgi:hypothetical protein